MTAIPPNWLSSVVGAHGAQDQSQVRRVKEAADQAERSSSGQFRENLQNIIDNRDRDTEVYTDSEGMGSQGRPFSEGGEEQAAEQQPEAEAGDEGLDIRA